MRKRALLCLVVFSCFFLTGCFGSGKTDIVKDFTKKVESVKGYHLTGDLSIVSNEETYQYNVDVSYKADDQFRVSLKNKTNNHEQIILKNTEGVYV